MCFDNSLFWQADSQFARNTMCHANHSCCHCSNSINIHITSHTRYQDYSIYTNCCSARDIRPGICYQSIKHKGNLFLTGSHYQTFLGCTRYTEADLPFQQLRICTVQVYEGFIDNYSVTREVQFNCNFARIRNANKDLHAGKVGKQQRGEKVE